MSIKVERNEKFHRGPACYRQNKDGSVTVLCPYGHYRASVAPSAWANSVWRVRASWGQDIITCGGALPADAKPYPFADTFIGTQFKHE